MYLRIGARTLALVLLATFTVRLDADPDQNQTYQNQVRIRQLELDQKTSQIQQDLKAQSNTMLNSSTTSAQRTFSPSLPGYFPQPRNTTNQPVKKKQVEAYLKGLGDAEKGTGIYAFPPEERLYRYGLMCIEVGFVSEGVRAITDHLRITKEQGQ